MKVSWNKASVVVKTDNAVFEISKNDKTVKSITIASNKYGSIRVDMRNGELVVERNGSSIAIKSLHIGNPWFTDIESLMSEIKSNPDNTVEKILSEVKSIIDIVFSHIPS